MKSINGINWKSNNIPERLILKKKQSFNISYLLSKIFLDKKYSDEEIYNSINNNHGKKLIYHNQDFEYASNFVIDCIKNNKRILIFGDYDVDGYSSTYLLYDFFGNFKVNCDYYVPDRFSDGYGPNKLLLKLIRPGIRLCLLAKWIKIRSSIYFDRLTIQDSVEISFPLAWFVMFNSKMKPSPSNLKFQPTIPKYPTK